VSDRWSDFLAAGAQFLQYGVDAFFVDYSHAFGRHTKFHKPLLRLDPEFVGMKVWQKSPSGSIFGVRDIIAAHWAFTRLANFQPIWLLFSFYRQ